jgi:hypothetical protein
LSPSQLVTPLADVGQGVHEVPQAATLMASTHSPLHGFLPAGQLPSHTASRSTHRSRQTFLPSGHITPHLMPSQVAAPPIGLGQGSQADPQLADEVLSTQPTVGHVCFPGGQTGSGGIATGASAEPPDPPGPPTPAPPALEPPSPPRPPAGDVAPSARAAAGPWAFGSY